MGWCSEYKCYLFQQQSLIPCVKTEAHRGGNSNNNPYLAFRRRTEKMQTRKNRKNDESTYEKMVKLKRNLSRAVTLLELVKRRENSKRELLHLTVEIFEKRFQAQDFSGQLLAEVSAMKASRPAFAPLFTNQFNHGTSWSKPVKDLCASGLFHTYPATGFQGVGFVRKSGLFHTYPTTGFQGVGFMRKLGLFHTYPATGFQGVGFMRKSGLFHTYPATGFQGVGFVRKSGLFHTYPATGFQGVGFMHKSGLFHTYLATGFQGVGFMRKSGLFHTYPATGFQGVGFVRKSGLFHTYPATGFQGVGFMPFSFLHSTMQYTNLWSDISTPLWSKMLGASDDAGLLDLR
ncbi:Glycosyltransferase 64 protein C4 [Homalodisca vitripennis]|nr:Glycosyltransferase 64 protein C4 [Homalodisca vitripennis]